MENKENGADATREMRKVGRSTHVFFFINLTIGERENDSPHYG